MAAAAATNSASEVEETLARIRSHNGVEGVIIMNREGEPERCSVEFGACSYRAARGVVCATMFVCKHLTACVPSRVWRLLSCSYRAARLYE